MGIFLMKKLIITLLICAALLSAKAALSFSDSHLKGVEFSPGKAVYIYADAAKDPHMGFSEAIVDKAGTFTWPLILLSGRHTIMAKQAGAPPVFFEVTVP